LEALKLPKSTILVIVPGHTAAASNAGRPVALVAEALAAAKGSTYEARIDALIRATSIVKLARGGERSVDGQLDSMTLTNPASFKDRTVVVLDDVVTTEGSIRAARTLLERAGAKVAAIGIGRTVKYF
jgi:predicted amidophosphoribosyltransferase